MNHRNHISFIIFVGLLILLAGLAGATPIAAIPEDNPSANVVLELGGTDQYVEVPHDPALNPTTAFTLEAWVKRDNDSRCETIISKGYTTAYWLGFCNTVIRFYAEGGSFEDGTTPVPANIWTHIAVVYEGSGRKYYINGELDYVGGPELAPTTNSLPVRIGSDSLGCCDFDGRISNVRLWNVARTQDEIRRTMHVALDESLPGLVANWRFNYDYDDNIGGFNGTSVGSSLMFEDPPAQPVYADVVEVNFNTLPLRRYAAATAYVPSLDRVLLIGGRRGTVSVTNDIDAIDASTGESTSLGNLPTNLGTATAAYVASNDTVYVFGGHLTSSIPGTAVDTIYAINPATGDVRLVSATLPQPTLNQTAVYHPGQDKVYIFGGYANTGDAVDDISIFDPVSETLTTPIDFTLPGPAYGTSAIYSAATGYIYLFGGREGLTNTDAIYEVTLDEDGNGGTLTLLPTALPAPDYQMRVFSDPHTHLIYLLGYFNQDWLRVFDPTTMQLWPTRIPIPDSLDQPSVAYSPINRHALFIGGDTGISDYTNVWRIPIGDGPLVPLGHWDFPSPVGAGVNAIDGQEDGVIVATDGDGAWLYEGDGSRYHYTPGILVSGNGIVHDGTYVASNGYIRLATDDSGAKVDDGTTLTTYAALTFGTNQVLSVGAGNFFGTGGEGFWWRYFSIFPPPGNYQWVQNFPGESIQAIAHRSPGDLFILSTHDLKRLTYSTAIGTSTETNFGPRCSLLNPTDLTIDLNGDWWIVSPNATEFNGNGICRIPAAETPGTGTRMSVLEAYGDLGTAVDVDGDGRVWVSLAHDAVDSSGGLVVFGTTDGTATVRSTEYNWLNAPIGSRNQDGSLIRYWDSSLTAVGATEEKMWAGKSDGSLVTLAQRWQQIDQSNDIGDEIIQSIWTARGRAFMATSSSLHVLMPDGYTWDNRTTSRVWDVLGDREGRIWVATNTGIRLYTDTTWDYLTDKEGTRPSTAVYALAEDRDGRIWIGGLYGLTLFDRDRFVATFTPANSGLHDDTIRTLFVDNENRLWAGTDTGLARLDGAEWSVFTTADGLPDNQIYDIDQLGTGQIAISTANGLSFYNGSSFVTQSPGVPANYLPLSVDESGRLWAGNAVLTGDGWKVYYQTNSGLASDEISDNATDGVDRIWFSHAPDPGVSVRGTYLPPLANVIPVIADVTPATGGAGTELTITGSGFGGSESAPIVTVGQAPAEVINVEPDEIRVRLTGNNTSGDVSVLIGERRTTWNGFCAIPTIDRFTPTGGNDGVRVHIYGQNFDPAADIFLGSDNDRAPHVVDATHHWVDISSDDGTGSVRVINQCGYTATATGEFRRITVNLEQIVLNQGIQSMGLVADRPTMTQLYLSHSIVPRPSDRLEVDYVELTFDEPGQAPFVHRLWVANEDTDGDGVTDAPTLFTLDSAPTAAELREINNSFNVNVTPDLVGGLPPIDSQVQVTARLQRGGRVLDEGEDTFGFRRDLVLRVLLVPIMENGYTSADVEALRNSTNAGLDNLRRRLFPTGRVELYWSPIAFSINDVIITDESQVDIGDTLTLYDASHNIDYARRMWNDRRDPDVMLAFGVVDPDVNNGSATGKAFWPDIAQIMNDSGFTALDALCDVGAFILDLFTFGAVGDDGCDLEVPIYVGWGEGGGGSSQLIGHEMGHMLGLSRPPSPNANLFDNFSHSITDELDMPGDADGETCGDLATGSANYDTNLTLYRAAGVQEPVVNPITGVQIRPQFTVSSTAVFSAPDTITVTNEAITPRAKAIMSYACSRNNNNVFFEPADMVGIFYEYVTAPARLFRDSLDSELGVGALATNAIYAAADGPTPIPVAGERLYVSGIVDRAANTGELRRVNIIGADGPLDISYETGYWLVQLDGGDNELARSGVFPVFATSEEEIDTGFFAATMLAQAGVARIELRHHDTLLDSFSAGSKPPDVSISSPSGGSFSSGSIPVTWSASDSDGDDLEIAILYSADGGTTWTPVGFSRENGDTADIAIATLTGSTNARMKVIASDGFNSSEVISPPFTVAAQLPQPAIGAPEDGSLLLEGDVTTLFGSASDNQDLIVEGDNLHWMSDRDGDLGTGDGVDVLLSVGTHVLTLEATNSQGLSASTAVTVTVLGDYDFDGIPDAEELADGLNLLTAVDAFSDDDQDGLTLLVERQRGLNPNAADTDGDGRNDDDELAAGTDPATIDDPLPPDSLSVYPASLIIDRDLSLDTAMPQAQVQLFSRSSVSWTVTADVEWLVPLQTEGQTPDGVTIIVDTEMIFSDGTYTGNLTFSSDLGVVVVPVTATMTNVPSKIYIPIVIKG